MVIIRISYWRSRFRRSSAPTEVYRYFPQTLNGDSVLMPQTGHDRIRSSSFYMLLVHFGTLPIVQFESYRKYYYYFIFIIFMRGMYKICCSASNESTVIPRLTSDPANEDFFRCFWTLLTNMDLANECFSGCAR